MWNSFNTADYAGMLAETIDFTGHEGKAVRAYYSRPLMKDESGRSVPKPAPGIVLIPHMPGWDEWCRETARRFTEHGYRVLCPNIYQDFGDGTPSEVSKRMWEQGGASDASVMGDCKGALDFLKSQEDGNGKVGVIGMCSGGRHTFLAACTIPGFDAAVDCWGGGVIAPKEELTPSRPVAPIEYVEDLQIPLLGIFGNDDKNPSAAQVDQTEKILLQFGKNYQFHRYVGAGHGIWYYDKPMYRQEAAMDSWNVVLDFFDMHLKNES